MNHLTKLQTLCLILVLCLFSSLCGTQGPPRQSLSLKAANSPSTGKPVYIEQHMGVAFQGKRIGTSLFTLEPVEHPSGKYLCRETLSITGAKTETEAILREDLTIENFDFRFLNSAVGAGDIQCKGQRKSDSLEVEVHSEGTVTRKEIPLSGPCYLSCSAHLVALLWDLKPGTSITCDVFDPMIQSLAPMEMEIGKPEKRKALDKVYAAYPLTILYQKIDQTSWMTSEGLRLEDKAMNGSMTAWLETPEDSADALSELNSSGDISGFMQEMADQFKVRVQGVIPQPRACQQLTIEVTGIKPEDVVLDDYWQRLQGEPSEKKFVLEIGLEETASAKQDDLKEHLASTFLIQSDAPEIRNQTAEIVLGTTDEREKAQKLVQWVYENLDRSKLRMTIPSAVEVLKSKSGDCNEHAVLFVALCRAAGIPARICAGLVYMRGGFYYHAWAEVYLTTWVSIDPTLNQFPADVTHIKFVHGSLEQQTKLLKLIGKLSIEVIEYL